MKITFGLISLMLLLVSCTSQSSIPTATPTEQSPNMNKLYVDAVHDQARVMFSGLQNDDSPFRNVQVVKFISGFNVDTLISAGKQVCKSIATESPKPGKYEHERYTSTLEKINAYLSSRFVLPDDPGYKQLDDDHQKFLIFNIREVMSEIIIDNAEAAYCPDLLTK